MKRRVVHGLFGAAALAFAALAALHGWRLHRAERVNAAITVAAGPAALADDMPEAQFAGALRLAAAGDHERALKIYKALARGDRADLRQAALYNLGNLYLREALKDGAREAARSLPLIELAKQSYRDLLRSDPGDWDARYNLERALWLAPEQQEHFTAGAAEPAKERAVTTMRVHGGDLP
jgi:mxaK protein